MKDRNRIILQVFIVLALFALMCWTAIASGCALSAPEVTTEIPSFETPAEVHTWVRLHIKYQTDPGTDYWKPAEQTLLDGFGDCEDRGITTLWICFKQFELKGQLGIYYNSRRKAYHGVPIVDGVSLEHISKSMVLRVAWPYDAAMFLAGRLRYNEEDIE